MLFFPLHKFALAAGLTVARHQRSGPYAIVGWTPDRAGCMLSNGKCLESGDRS